MLLHDLADVWLRVPDTLPESAVPSWDLETEPYWAALADHRFVIQRCGECRRWAHPPTPICPACGSSDRRFEEPSGRGTLYSFTVCNREFTPGLTPPYAVGLVALREQSGLHLVSQLVNVRVADLEIGMALQVVPRAVGSTVLPYAEPLDRAV